MEEEERGWHAFPWTAKEVWLTRAVFDDRLEDVVRMVEQGALLSARNRALRTAARKGRARIVRYLLSTGADVHAYEDDALCWASREGHSETVRILLEAGADVHARGDDPFCWASREGHLRVMHLLEEAGADVHARGDDALYMAARQGHLEAVEFLVDECGSRLSSTQLETLPEGPCKEHVERGMGLFTKSAAARGRKGPV